MLREREVIECEVVCTCKVTFVCTLRIHKMGQSTNVNVLEPRMNEHERSEPRKYTYRMMCTWVT